MAALEAKFPANRGLMPAASGGTSTRKRASTRDRMLFTAAEVLREKGAAGVTIDEVLTRSGAPRGSVYHHFPDGRSQLLAEALRFAGDSITAGIDEAATQGCIALIRQFVGVWERTLVDSDFAAGCPVFAAAMGAADEGAADQDSSLTAIAGDIFGRWHQALTRAFVADGFDDAEAASLAVTSIAALEGAVVLCRSTHSATPLREVSQQVEFLIKSREFVKRFGLPAAR